MFPRVQGTSGLWPCEGKAVTKRKPHHCLLTCTLYRIRSCPPVEMQFSAKSSTRRDGRSSSGGQAVRRLAVHSNSRTQLPSALCG